MIGSWSFERDGTATDGYETLIRSVIDFTLSYLYTVRPTCASITQHDGRYLICEAAGHTATIFPDGMQAEAVTRKKESSRGAQPPVDLREVCIVRAIIRGSDHGLQNTEYRIQV